MSRRRATLLCTRVHPSWCTGPVLDNPSRSTDCEPISSTGSAGSSARRLRQVGSSARRLRQVGWSAQRLRQEPFDEPSARMKCRWRAFLELSELSAESLRQVVRTRKIPRAAQDCSKLVTPMCWKWLSRICGGQHQVEPDPIGHNPPCRHQSNRRHHQWNFIIEHFQIQVPARAHHRLVSEATGQRSAKHQEGDITQDPIFTFT